MAAFRNMPGIHSIAIFLVKKNKEHIYPEFWGVYLITSITVQDWAQDRAFAGRTLREDPGNAVAGR